MIKLVSVNIERSRHYRRLIPFLKQETPDILLIQEVIPEDIPWLKEELGMPHSISMSDARVRLEEDPHGREIAESGIALFSRLPLTSLLQEYYYLPQNGIQLEDKHMVNARETNAAAVLAASIEKDGKAFTFATTHFTWTFDGRPNEYQEEDFKNLMALLEQLPPHILAGDLNAPRGLGMWERFKDHYAADNIPTDIANTLDPVLHKAPHLRLVVDALFSHDVYKVSEVRLIPDISDHQAVSAAIERM